MNLEEYKKAVDDLYQSKGWNTDWMWLYSALNVEIGELGQEILKQRTEQEKAEEFADVMHYLLELMKQQCPSADLDVALLSKITSNKVNKKKTTDKAGNVVLK